MLVPPLSQGLDLHRCLLILQSQVVDDRAQAVHLILVSSCKLNHAHLQEGKHIFSEQRFPMGCHGLYVNTHTIYCKASVHKDFCGLDPSSIHCATILNPAQQRLTSTSAHKKVWQTAIKKFLPPQ